jgi:hypothetical protein
LLLVSFHQFLPFHRISYRSPLTLFPFSAICSAERDTLDAAEHAALFDPLVTAIDGAFNAAELAAIRSALNAANHSAIGIAFGAAIRAPIGSAKYASQHTA